jgi:hypothetical protein
LHRDTVTDIAAAVAGNESEDKANSIADAIKSAVKKKRRKRAG